MQGVENSHYKVELKEDNISTICSTVEEILKITLKNLKKEIQMGLHKMACRDCWKQVKAAAGNQRSKLEVAEPKSNMKGAKSSRLFEYQSR